DVVEMAGSKRHIVAGVRLVGFNNPAQSIGPGLPFHACFIYLKLRITKTICSRSAQLCARASVRAHVCSEIVEVNISVGKCEASQAVKRIVRVCVEAIGWIAGAAVEIGGFLHPPT